MAKIDNQERINNLQGNQYQALLGVDKSTFEKMYGILLEAYIELHKQGGKPPTLTVLDKLVITLGYWREYRAYRNIAFDYGVGKSAIGNAIIWVENTLISNGEFAFFCTYFGYVYMKEADGVMLEFILWLHCIFFFHVWQTANTMPLQAAMQ